MVIHAGEQTDGMISDHALLLLCQLSATVLKVFPATQRLFQPCAVVPG
jgi:hypothetical protein